MRCPASAVYTLLLLTSLAATAQMPIWHKVVFKEPGRFAGWPGNNGIWSWGDEIVVGFTLGDYEKNPDGGHDIARDKPSTTRQARSLDGGETWTIERPSFVKDDDSEREPARLVEAIDFSNTDLAMRFREDRFYYSPDRCRTWHGPFTLPHFGRPGLLARTDYLIEGPARLTAFVAAEKESGGEGQPLCIRTTDGGLTWAPVGWIGAQPPAGYGYAIMPATVALSDGAYLSIIRRGGIVGDTKQWWLEAFLSPDAGRSWYMLDQPRIDNGGNPATLTRLRSGTIAMTYGWRHAPYGIRARISPDNGQTWGPETILRDDGASWDLGYPRTVQRGDGNCVTVYYFHHPDQPERYIACTIWEPR